MPRKKVMKKPNQTGQVDLYLTHQDARLLRDELETLLYLVDNDCNEHGERVVNRMAKEIEEQLP